MPTLFPLTFLPRLTAPLLAALLAFAGPLSAQPAFDLFTLGEFEVSDVYTFDAAFTERTGFEVAVPFRVNVPRHRRIGVVSSVRPEGGAFVAFSFSFLGEGGQPQQYLESLQITDATIPLFADSPSPLQARLDTAARLLEQDVFPSVTRGYVDPRILGIEVIAIGGVEAAVQMVARYFDPQYNEETLVWAVILPHPDRAESYMAAANINLNMVPVADQAALLSTLSGRVLATWEYR